MWWLAAACAVAGCQLAGDGTAAETAEAAQADTGSCSNATWPAQVGYWKGEAPPPAGATQMFISFPDPTTNDAEYIGALVDYASCAVVWTARTPTANLGAFVAALTDSGQLDVSNKPPPPPPKGWGVYTTVYAGGIAAAYKAASGY
jgi:hypothetical protein